MFSSIKSALYTRVLGVTAAGALCATLGLAAMPQANAAPRPAEAKAPAQVTSVQLSKSATAELAWLRRQMANPAKRAEILADLQAAFAHVGKVGIGSGSSTPTRRGVTPDLAYGHDGTHFWVTASYADIADGAIYGAIGACAASQPELADVCELAGETLVDWSRGWGRANNHGVWAAVYWWPPHFTGGRW